MDNVVGKKRIKKMVFAAILLCSCICLLTGCFDFLGTVQVRKKIMKVWECIKERDKDKLFEYFTEDIRVNRKVETMKDIDSFFDHIDGKMVFYRYNSGGLQEITDKGEPLYYNCTPEIYLKTDTGKKYIIQFSFNHKWAKHPEREGIELIYLIEGEEVDLGKASKFGKTDLYDDDIY